MKYRKIGKTGVDVSALGFGMMRLPTLPLDPGNPKGKTGIDEPQAIKIVRHAIDNGVNYLDTAYGYHDGMSEVVAGRALLDGYREKVNLATKFPCWNCKKQEDFDRILNEQLDKLQTDHLDFYLLHSLSRKSWRDICLPNKVFDQLVAARESGKVRHIGFSFHDDLRAFKEIVDYSAEWEFCQIQLNYLDTDYQAGLAGMKYAAARGLGVIVMEPLRGGALSDVSPEVAKIFEPTGKTPVEWALDYIWNKPEVSLLLSGMGSMQMVRDNLLYAGRSGVGMITQKDTEIIAKAQQAIQGENTIPCTSCSYCMPCPHGVAIPYNFQTFNNLSKGKTEEECKTQYEEWVPMFGKNAAGCVSCGVCVPKCPQHIAIPERLKEVAAKFG